MNNNMKPLVLGLVIGGILSATSMYYLNSNNSNATSSEASSASVEKKPLYWVAPMNPNYKRDKPGKSPMGMDLIPVYADGASGDTGAGVGTIKVSPDVVNNLGVRTVTAQYSQLHDQIDTVGYVGYDEDKLVHVHPRVKGWIEKLYVKAIGDPVQKGQKLYDIYSPELVNAQEELLLALERKNVRLIQAAENRLVALQLPTDAIKQLKKQRKIQQFVTFRAPQQGVLEMLNIREGFYVQPGTSMLAIGDLSEVWVEAEVFERQASAVKVATPVTMELDYLPGKKWQGKVDYIYPTLDPKTRTVKVRLRFDNSNDVFKPNMFAQISIHIQDEGEALLIPKEALIRTGNQDRVVLALGNGQFKSIAVKVGRFDHDRVEIIEGLNAGDNVVSSAQFLLDSESSKTSDFIRMNHGEQTTSMSNMDMSNMDMSNMDMSAGKSMDMSNMDMSGDTAVSSADSTGVIVSLMPEHGMITIDREAIEKWNRPAATVDFMADQTIDLTPFKAGQKVSFTFEIRDGEFIVTKINSVADQQ
jgi:Cu(I)/Ag(I) efflux system membrane fusion protein